MMGRLLRRWAVWALVVVAAAAALAVGAHRPSHPTLEQRSASLASEVRCPVCGGESAAQSQVPAALAIRNQIHQELADGTPPSKVLDDLVKAYGTGILERPPAQGIGLLVWVLPVAIVVVAAAGLGLAFSRWHRPRRGRGPVVAGPRPEDQALVARALGDPAATGGPPARPPTGPEHQ